YLWFEKAVPRILKKYNIDVFFSGDMYMSLKTNVPTLLVSHDLNYLHYPKALKWSHLKFLNYYFPKYHSAADHIIAVSEYTKKDIINQYGIKKDKITVAYNATPEKFYPLDEKEKQAFRDKYTSGCPYFAYIGSLHPRKNVATLLLAFDKFKKLTNSNEKLILHGRLAFKTKKMLAIYEGMAYKSDVILQNDNQCDIVDVLGASLSLCYVSLFEGFGIPILEAFKSEVPVITSNVTSMPEVAGDAAILVDPLNPDEIAEAMKEISVNESVRQQLIEKGKERLQYFSWDKSAQIILNKLKNLVKN
ncbi:MAG: glycosyltransferase family 4 protein, partial [Bacteroidia bacterium]|nr:glycosyltransferase family 4 protein [Bacteroidia bacterium]